MTIITKSSVTKGTPASFTLNLADLLAHTKVDSSSYWKVSANWAQVYLQYKSSVGGQNKVVQFLPVNEAQGIFSASLKARDSFQIISLTIEDLDGGALVLNRSDLVTADFDVSANSPALTLILLFFTHERLEGGTSFIDSSLSAHTVTAENGAITSLIDSMGGDWGASYLGNGGLSKLRISDDANLDCGVGNFTLDCWIKLQNAGQALILTAADLIVGNVSNQLKIAVPSTNSVSAFTAPWNTWTHVAFVREIIGGVGVTSIYINGIEDTVTWVKNNLDNVPVNFNSLVIGGIQSGYGGCLGNIDELRISKGIARWSENFVPPTAPY